MVSAILEIASTFCFCNIIHFTLNSSNFFITRTLRLSICCHSLTHLDLTHTPVFLPSERLVRPLSCFALLDRGVNDFLYKMPTFLNHNNYQCAKHRNAASRIAPFKLKCAKHSFTEGSNHHGGYDKDVFTCIQSCLVDNTDLCVGRSSIFKYVWDG